MREAANRSVSAQAFASHTLRTWTSALLVGLPGYTIIFSKTISLCADKPTQAEAYATNSQTQVYATPSLPTQFVSI